jgi:hypothetical protein
MTQNNPTQRLDRVREKVKQLWTKNNRHAFRGLLDDEWIKQDLRKEI